MRLRLTLIALALFGGTPGAAVGAQAAGNDSVTIRLSYAARFSRTPQYSRLVSLFARVLPRQRQRVTADSSLEELIFRRYNVSAGPKSKARGYYLPEIVDSIRREILAANGLDRRTEVLPPGTYDFPSVPAQATWNSKITNPASYSPHVVRVPASPAFASAPARTAGSFADTLALPSKVSPARVMEMRVARDEAGSIVAGLDSVKAVVSYEISAPFGYRYGMQSGGPPPYNSAFPDTAQLARIRELLARPRRRVPLVILDTYWPSDSIARASCARMAAILGEIRLRWKIPAPPQPECAALAFAAPPATERHSALVFQAVAPLQRTAPGAADIIFVPLGTYQGARPLLMEIVRVEDLVEAKLAALAGAASQRPVPDVLTSCAYSAGAISSLPACAAEFPLDTSVLRHAQERASLVVARLPADLSAPRATDRYRSATDLLTGSIRLLSWYGLHAKQGAVVSASWTTDLLNGNLVDARQAANVILVAAAGNDQLTVTREPVQVDFGRRVATREPVLAAIDVDSQRTLTCNSSVVDTMPDRLRQEFAASFDGYVADACGTSFAAPRIAWFAAAAESLRWRDFESAHWASDLMATFERSRSCRDEPALRDIALDPVKLLTLAAGRKLPPDPHPPECNSP